jgi:hypothetical protein
MYPSQSWRELKAFSFINFWHCVKKFYKEKIDERFWRMEELG